MDLAVETLDDDVVTAAVGDFGTEVDDVVVMAAELDEEVPELVETAVVDEF